MRRVGQAAALLAAAAVLWAHDAYGARVFLNPSNQTSNPVCGGGNEAEYALDMANRAQTKIEADGHAVIVDQDFRNAPIHANNWGADIFISIHSNAGGGHGIETLYVSDGGRNLASHVNAGVVNADGHEHTIDRGLKYRSDLYVLNTTNMYACLPEVLFHDCCSVEAPYLRTAAGRDVIAGGIRDGVCSYYGGCGCTGPCSAGQSESQDCCDCGTQQRTCGGDCQWGDWGACAGPDPDDGTRECDAGGEGPCADGIMRCIDGCLGCMPLIEPADEACDDLDNDCDGEIDDGFPAVMGESLPAHAASLVDFSFPLVLDQGERVEVWAAFRNEGSEVWRAGEVTLAAASALDGSTSPFHAAGAWLSGARAAELDATVEEGESATFLFTIQAPESAGGEVSEIFVLLDPSGDPMRCPSPQVEVTVRVNDLSADDEADGDGDGGVRVVGMESGCTCTVIPR